MRALFILALLIPAFASFAQEPVPIGGLTSTEREITTLREDLEKKRQSVAKAVSAAAKAGTLKTSTEGYFRDLLEKLNAPEGSLPDFEAAYFPPTFDTSEDMEPINLAWRDLKLEVARIQSRTTAMNSIIVEETAGALRRVAESSEKPEDLDKVDKLIALLRRLPDVSKNGASASTSAKELLQQISDSARASLDAAQNNDLPAITEALSQISDSRIGSLANSRNLIPFRTDKFLETLRARLIKPFVKVTKELQLTVEKAIIDGDPKEKLEKLLDELSEKADSLDNLWGLNWKGTGSSSDRSRLINTYRMAATSGSAINQGDSDLSSIPAVGFEAQFPVSADFLTYLNSLRARALKNRNTMLEAADAKRRENAERTEAEDRKKRAEVLRKDREASDAKIAHIKKRILAVESAEATLALADELPVNNEVRDPLSNWPSLQSELREIGNWWLEGAAMLSLTAKRTAQGIHYGNPFSVETQALRVRAARDVALKHYNLPQLKEPPYAAMELSAALDKLSQEAAAAGDWKRSYESLRIIPVREPAGSGPMQDRLQTLKNYLTGLNLESAGQFREAADAYLGVIREVGDFLPTKEASTRLKTLQKANPQLLKERREPTRNTRK